MSQLNGPYNGEFVVVKIDSIHSYYLIYARKGKELVKIISQIISGKGKLIRNKHQLLEH
jgi:hypothetical protein